MKKQIENQNSEQLNRVVKIVPNHINKQEVVVVSDKDFKCENLARLTYLSCEDDEQIPFLMHHTTIYDIVDYLKEQNKIKSNFKIVVDNLYCRKDEIKPIFSTTYEIHFKFENDSLTLDTIYFERPITLLVNYKYHDYKELDEIIEKFITDRGNFNKIVCEKYTDEPIEMLFEILL